MSLVLKQGLNYWHRVTYFTKMRSRSPEYVSGSGFFAECFDFMVILAGIADPSPEGIFRPLEKVSFPFDQV